MQNPKKKGDWFIWMGMNYQVIAFLDEFDNEYESLSKLRKHSKTKNVRVTNWFGGKYQLKECTSF